MTYHLTLKSRNVKTGAMPVSTTSAKTCPTSCPFNSGNGCYAAGGPLAMHWRKVTAGKAGSDLATFAAQIAALPDGTLWRHNQAGDLPGEGDMINAGELAEIVDANRGKRGFTYTHKPMAGANLDAVKAANEAGFTVNLSGNNLAHADELADTGAGPVVVVLDAAEGQRHDVMTPAGRKVATCPATYRDDVSCASCGLCQKRDRKVIVGFPAHGASKRKAAAVARS